MAPSTEEFLATVEREQLKVSVLSDHRIAVNNREHSYDFVQTARGEYSLLLNGRSYQIFAAGQFDDTDSRLQTSYSITLNGHEYIIEVDDKRSFLLKSLAEGKKSSAGSAVLHSPMPGLVVKVEVQEGEEVKAGQGLIVLEAMKMENELKATGKGKVTAIHVLAGRKVEKGEKLITIASS